MEIFLPVTGFKQKAQPGNADICKLRTLLVFPDKER